jgi:hypothetical protein
VGATTISGTSLQAAGTINVGNEFYIQGQRTLYTVAQSITIAANTAAIVFYPGLESDIASTTTTFTFVSSTLNPDDEDVISDLAAAKLAINKAPKLYMQANSALVTLTLASSSLQAMTSKIAAATATADSAITYIHAATIMAGGGETASLTAMNTQISAATAAAASALALINTMPIVLGAENDAMQQASVDVNNAVAYMRQGLNYLNFTKAQEGFAKDFLDVTSSHLAGADREAHRADEYMKQASGMLSISSAGRNLEAWGKNKLNEVYIRLLKETKPKTRKRYSTEL